MMDNQQIKLALYWPMQLCYRITRCTIVILLQLVSSFHLEYHRLVSLLRKKKIGVNRHLVKHKVAERFSYSAIPQDVTSILSLIS